MTFILKHWLPFSGAIVLLVLSLTYYGNVQYNKGYADQNLKCVEQKQGDDNARNKDIIKKQKDWSKIDAAPSAGIPDILIRMRKNDL